MKKLVDLLGWVQAVYKTGSTPRKEPRIIGDRSYAMLGCLTLHFDEFMDAKMKGRIYYNRKHQINGTRNFMVRFSRFDLQTFQMELLMDRETIFDGWYVPDRISRGWEMIDREGFTVEWHRPDINEVVIGEYEYMGLLPFTVSERIKKIPVKENELDEEF